MLLERMCQAATATSVATQVCRLHERLRSGPDLAARLRESPDAVLPFVHEEPTGGEPPTDDQAGDEVLGRVQSDAALREFERIRNVRSFKCKQGRDRR